jgi:hypothetical protein
MPDQAKKHPQQNQPKTSPSSNDARRTDPELQNEGEGSRTATRRYDERAEQAAKNPRNVQKLADEARKALEGPDGQKLRQAEQQGKNAKHR